MICFMSFFFFVHFKEKRVVDHMDWITSTYWPLVSFNRQWKVSAGKGGRDGVRKEEREREKERERERICRK